MACKILLLGTGALCSGRPNPTLLPLLILLLIGVGLGSSWGMDLRAYSMGDAYASLADNPPAIEWNPAILGLSTTQASHLLLSARLPTDFDDGLSFFQFDLITNVAGFGFGIQAGVVSAPPGYEMTATDEQGNRRGVFVPEASQILLGAGSRVDRLLGIGSDGPEIAFGADLKLRNLAGLCKSASVTDLDLGLLSSYRIWINEETGSTLNLRSAYVVRNALNRSVEFDGHGFEEEFDWLLGRRDRIGISLTGTVCRIQRWGYLARFILPSVDIENLLLNRDSNTITHIGAEANLLGLVFLRYGRVENKQLFEDLDIWGIGVGVVLQDDGQRRFGVRLDSSAASLSDLSLRDPSFALWFGI